MLHLRHRRSHSGVPIQRYLVRASGRILANSGNGRCVSCASSGFIVLPPCGNATHLLQWDFWPSRMVGGLAWCPEGRVSCTLFKMGRLSVSGRCQVKSSATVKILRAGLFHAADV